MCTVTFVPTSDGFIFTSNRDEKTTRKTSTPSYYTIDGVELFFPKDEQSGGTWIAISKNGTMACLLNGGFVGHTKKDFHTISRGKILLSRFSFASPEMFIDSIQLNQVEPFTLLLLSYTSNGIVSFKELIWDGYEKHVQEIPLNQPAIWSSSTLYSKTVQEKRRQLFSNWISKNRLGNSKSIFSFHSQNHGWKDEEAIFMSREGNLKTTSISQVCVENNLTSFTYFDALENKVHETQFKFSI